MSRQRRAVEVTDAAQMLSNPDNPVSKSSVYRLVRSGELEGYKLSDKPTAKIYIWEDSIADFLARRAVTPSYDRKRIRELLAK